MSRFIYIIVLLVLTACKSLPEASTTAPTLTKTEWTGKWIAPTNIQDTVNVWLNFYKEFTLTELPNETVTAQIAADSKYWLWINGKLVVRDGQLKRGPTPEDSYYDELDIATYLKEGKNKLAVLVWYFGKDGFSHKSSGKPGLFFQANGKNFELKSDDSWKAWQNKAFKNTEAPFPNFRLPESNKRYDARLADFDFTREDFKDENTPVAVEIGEPGGGPWNQLIKRPIPFWKDYGLKSYENAPELPLVSKGDTLKLKLPYNAHITPYFKIEATEGQQIDLRTDHYYGGGPPNLRTEYITKEAMQEFEDFGWINGHEVHYYIPEGITIHDLKYRETGYDTEFKGSFSCDDPFYNRLWEKAKRTLYVTMRDTYMDCPDRERAQWWGDVVLESGESFYVLDRNADALTKKGILELMNWQRADSTIFSPVPAGNWNQELPGQMLASVGYYGFYNYYLNTGDLETIREVYEPVKAYLSLWKLREDGTLRLRKGDWTWADWGKNRDVRLILNTQYFLALKGQYLMAEALGDTLEQNRIKIQMEAFVPAFNKTFWQGSFYRSEDHIGETDDRSQGLAVVAGLTDSSKYEAIYKVLQKEQHASPYMEKYILEALFQMGYTDFALQRMKERFGNMVNHPTLTTLWEGWGIGKEGYGGGTVNHAWSGGGLTLLSQYVAGISPITPGYEQIRIKPQLGFLKEVSASVPSIRGQIVVDIKKDDHYTLKVKIPEGVEARIYLPSVYTRITVNDKETSLKTEGADRYLITSGGSYQIKGFTN
ncbi:alpha-L-rhamnosidase C-terminal domain-containing protein [Flavobacteriaceae bacterium M23B6Z8]